MASHYWISASCRSERDQARATIALPPVFATIDAHRRLRGPYTAAGTLMRLIGVDALERCPGLGPRHYIEIQESTPELTGSVPPIARKLESAAAPGEVSRYPARLHTLRISHGLAEFLRDYLAALGEGPRTLVVENAHEADPTDQEFLAVLLQRLAPEQLTVVVCTGSRPLADPPGPRSVSLPEALAARTIRVAGDARQPDDAVIDSSEIMGLAWAYVESDGASDDPDCRKAYERLGPERRASLHDERAAALAPGASISLRLGAIPYHAEHGSNPAADGATAIRWAQVYCKKLGFYHTAAEYGARGRVIVDSVNQPELWWGFTCDMAVSLSAAGRAAEAEVIHDEVRMLSIDPVIHMKFAYETAMLYARHYEDQRRNKQLARAWVNQSIAIAALLADPKERAFYSVFYRNGLALVEMRGGHIDEALRLLDEGIERLDRDLSLGERTMHRTGLRYNRAQVNGMSGRLDEALADYTTVIEVDDTFPDHFFNRGNILRKLGRTEEAVADYERVLGLAPPFPEVYYNRGDARLELGDEKGAVTDFSRAIELDPNYVVARLNRASIRADRGELDEAMLDVTAGLASESGNAQLLCLNGRLLAELGDAEGARAALQAALRADPGIGEAWAIMAQISYESANLEAAITSFDRAIDLCDVPEIRFNRAVAYQTAGRFDEAITDFDAVVAASGDSDALLRRSQCLRAVAERFPA